MNQTLPEPAAVQLALREIAEARERLRLANDALIMFRPSEVSAEASPAAVGEARSLEIEQPPRDLLAIAQVIIEHVLPGKLAQMANQAGASPRDWLYRVHDLSCAPRGITDSVTTLVIMAAAVKFGLRHQQLLQTERRLGLAHKAPIANASLFLETFVSVIIEADRSDARFNDWLERIVAERYPVSPGGRRLVLPSGEYLDIPEGIKPIRPLATAPLSASALTSPIDPTSRAFIPPGGGWRITLLFAAILNNEAYPAFHGKHHSGIDIYRWNAYKAPVHAMRGGVVFDSVYLPKGFGNTVVVEHDEGTCLRYTHLDKFLVKKGERVVRGQQIGTIGKGANNIYAAHLHLDMPRSSAYARARTYYKTKAEVVERFIDPLSLIPAAI